MDHNPHNLAYMDLQTFLTIFLSCVFGLGIAIALYAMSIVTIDPRLARWGAYGAWLSLILLCIWFGGTNDMQRVWRYSLAAGIAAIATAALCASLDYIINRETQVKNSVAAASRIVVTKYLLTPVVPTDPKSDLSWQIYMMNRGPIPGYTPQFIFMPRLTDSILTEAEIDNGMLEVIQAALKMTTLKRQQIEVNQETWFTINDRLVRSNDFYAVKNGQKHLYVWIVLAFTDETLPANKFWISEFCGTQSGDITSIQICRQRTYLHG
jgi:hypothetical protein